MPRDDHSGPSGEGPMTGHGGGWCAVPADQVFQGDVGIDRKGRMGSCRRDAARARKRRRGCRVDR